MDPKDELDRSLLVRDAILTRRFNTVDVHRSPFGIWVTSIVLSALAVAGAIAIGGWKANHDAHRRASHKAPPVQQTGPNGASTGAPSGGQSMQPAAASMQLSLGAARLGATGRHFVHVSDCHVCVRVG